MVKKEKSSADKTKIITIRGVNQHLYEHFSNLAKRRGKNIGTVFSNMISYFRKKGFMTIQSLPILENLFENKKISIELVENLSRLEVSQKDLQTVPERIKFHFRNIKELIFKEAIPKELLMEKIFRITNCEVNFPSSLPKVYGLSKIRNYESANLEVPQKEKDITIRNVDAKAYNEFVAYCQLNNRLVSEVVNVLLAQIIPEMEINQIIIGELQENPLELLVISSLKKLEIKVEDLEQLNDKKIVFHRIKELTFSEKISSDLFISSVIAIYNCEDISLPNDLSNLLVVSRVRKYP